MPSSAKGSVNWYNGSRRKLWNTHQKPKNVLFGQNLSSESLLKRMHGNIVMRLEQYKCQNIGTGEQIVHTQG